ncbi:hypothetical protein CYMTET_38362 [Cymbomonas tetramitiformis]|uniref:Uncharacterized protein n=1 Tax=Cymbomonas tetramitiformis TaxID=36881 RepID=A0AAE0CC58_9CHLO|nr:hypothetical protein CYMTET_38362 [Cymbomonas tetramitiformis]
MNQNVERSLRPYAHNDASTSDQFVDLPFLQPVVFADDLACDDHVDDDEVAPFLKTEVLRTPVVRYSQSNNICTALRVHSSGIFQRGMCCMFEYGSHRKLGARITNIDEQNETAATRNLRVHNWRRQTPVEASSRPVSPRIDEDDYSLYMRTSSVTVDEDWYEALQFLPVHATLPRGCLVRAVPEVTICEWAASGRNETAALNFLAAHDITSHTESPDVRSYTCKLHAALKDQRSTMPRSSRIQGYQLLRSILRDVSHAARETVTHDLSTGNIFDSDVRNKLVYTMMYMNYHNGVAYAFLTNTQVHDLNDEPDARNPLRKICAKSDTHGANNPTLPLNTDTLLRLFYAREANAVTDILNDDDLTFLSSVRSAAGVDIMTLFDPHRLIVVAPEDTDARPVSYDDVRVRKGGATKRTPGVINNARADFDGDNADVCWVSQGIELFVTTMEEAYETECTALTTVDEAVLHRVRATSLLASPVKSAMLNTRVRAGALAASQYLARTGADTLNADLRVLSNSHAPKAKDACLDSQNELFDTKTRITLVRQFATEYVRALEQLQHHDFATLSECCRVCDKNPKPDGAAYEAPRVPKPVLCRVLRFEHPLLLSEDNDREEDTCNSASECVAVCVAKLVEDATGFRTRVDEDANGVAVAALGRDMIGTAINWLRTIATEYGQLVDDTESEVARDDATDATLLFWLRYMRDKKTRNKAYNVWRRAWSGGFVGMSCLNGHMYKNAPPFPDHHELRTLTHVELWSVVALELQLGLARLSIAAVAHLERKAVDTLYNVKFDDGENRQSKRKKNESSMGQLIGLFMRREQELNCVDDTPGRSRTDSVHQQRERVRNIEMMIGDKFEDVRRQSQL